jgi:hypothetical protein
MPLPRPILDDRAFEQLRNELVRRIPVYNPEWTDHNTSDPGITLLELFASLGEGLLFRFNQIPETTRLEFLRLLNVPLLPASASGAILGLSLKRGGPVLVPVGSEARAGAILFETRTEVRVLPVAARAVAKATADAPQAADAPEVFDHFQRSLDAIEGLKSTESAAAYENRVVSPKGDGPPVDFSKTVDGLLWVAVLADDAHTPAAARAIILDDPEAPLALNLGYAPDRRAFDGDAPPTPALLKSLACPGDCPATTAPGVVWQISTGRLDGTRPVYRTLNVVGDGTAGLTREGVVRLRLPRAETDFGTFALDDPDRGGIGDLPPKLDDPTEAKLIFWVRAYRPDGGRFGRVLAVVANATDVVQWRSARTEFLGAGTGQPGQIMTVINRPVIASSLVLEVEEPGGWRQWDEVESFDVSGPDDRHYTLDRESGEIHFGGLARVPQIGERVRARGYKFGGGAVGNVPPAAISKLPAFDTVATANPLAANGGEDGETVVDGIDRITGEFRRHDRAVTAGDFRELAGMTPGAGIARAECLPRFHPPSRKEDAAGVVTVIVWPKDDPLHPDAPVPDRAQLRAVCERLDARRLVTTELYVIPPRYRKIAASVGLRVKQGFGVDAVRHWVELVVRQYLAPLPPYGPSGEGWPLGRRVHGPELQAAALQVEGVEYLEGLEVAGWDPATGSWVSGTVTLDIDEVPELAAITVVEGPPAPAGTDLGPPSPDLTPVPIPILREVC